MITLKKKSIKDGINVYHIPTKKFKTHAVSICIHRQLNKEDVTKNALLPFVLKRGCTQYPTSMDISKKLEELYGSIFDFDISKSGEDQIISFNFEVIDKKYIKDSGNLLFDILELANSIIFDPVTENDAFKKEYVEQEKNNLKEQIESLINNKMNYAVERCYEEMCKDENFGMHELGKIEDLKSIDEKNLYDYYKEFISNSHIDIFIVGDINEEEIMSFSQKIFEHANPRNATYPVTKLITEVKDIKTVEQEFDVTQGKITLGFRTGVKPTDEKYFALLMYNGILGGGPHSKLFNNVREKLSLAYYVFSRLEKNKGIMIVSSGIEFKNYQKTLDEIIKQHNEIKAGNITDYEFDSTVKSIINKLKSIEDSAFGLADYYLGQLISGTDYSLEETADNIKAVSKKDIIGVAQGIKLDTIYFLKGKTA